MPLPSSWVVVVVGRYHYSTHQNHLWSCMSVPPSEGIELLLIYTHKLVLTSRTCTTKNSIGTKVRLGVIQYSRIKNSCTQLKTTRIHDSKFQTNAKVWSNLITNLESKVKVIRCGRILVRGSYSGGGEQKFPTQTRESQNFLKFHQQLSGITMHTFGIQRLPRKTAGQRLTKQ
jgi:hypothetical protein